MNTIKSNVIKAIDATDRIFQLWALMQDIPDLIDRGRQQDALTLFSLLDDEIETTIGTLREDLEAAHTILYEPTTE